MEISSLTLLCIFSFLAGLVDSIVGGGGLIQVPAMLIILPHLPITTILGTNKLVSITGTLVAASRYAGKMSLPWRIVLPTAAAAFGMSFLGAWVVSGISPDNLRPWIIVLLIVIAGVVYFRKDLGQIHAPRINGPRAGALGLLAGAAIGFYDGFFGPGAGTFLIFAFVGLFGMNFLFASASAKVVNASTNLAALIYFGLTGHILFSVALPMAVFNVLGAILGTRLAMWKGSRFVRVFFLVVVGGIILKLVYDTLTAA